ncbi:UbiA prenyltransferase family protein [candidate division CSSED10-310 bacterium]|uniref:UbiA prenyltransferase family protein n=1 Tax=candidate division CSSED10-310 bacterium TaxID=2855610 RepID=A0ABV6Z5N3_UNCC1
MPENEEKTSPSIHPQDYLRGPEQISSHFLKRQLYLFWLSLRPRESLMMLGVPVLGILFTEPVIDFTTFWKSLLFFIAAFAVAGHVYTLNDLCGLTYDIYDQHKLERPIHSKQLQAREVFLFSLLMLLVGLTFDYMLNMSVLFIALVISILWVIYAWPATLFKGIPILTSVMNGVGSGILPFLLGYALFCPGLDFKGFLISIYFGIIAGAGQMNREIIDYEPDRQANLTTTAVKYGCRPTFIVSFIFFLLSSIYFAGLCWLHYLPHLSLAAFPLTGTLIHAYFFYHYLKTDLGRVFVIKYVKCYRAIYAFVGVGILITTLAHYTA